MSLKCSEWPKLYYNHVGRQTHRSDRVEWKRFQREVPGVEFLSSDEESECYFDFVPSFVAETGYLPIECRECYKALIFWPFSKANESNFMRMLESLPVSIHGKYNDRVVVFYFKKKARMLIFLEILRENMNQFGVEGRIQWRVSGRYWQDDYPQLFKSAKELKPAETDKEITMKDWLRQQGLF
ncbi:hypothetical protein ES703_02475 [subsurface metagenome]